MNKLNKKVLFRVSAVSMSTVLLLLYVVTVDPTAGELLKLLVPIMFSWIVLFIVILSILEKFLATRRQSVIRFISATITSSGLFFLLLSGIGTISLVDILLTSSLVVLIAFYVSRLWK